MGLKLKMQPVGGWACRVPVARYFPPGGLFSSEVVQLDATRAVVRLRGELDLVGVVLLIASLTEVPEGLAELVLDFSELEFIDCSGLNAIATAARAREFQGGSLSISDPRADIQRVLGLVGFERMLAGTR